MQTWEDSLMLTLESFGAWLKSQWSRNPAIYMALATAFPCQVGTDGKLGPK